MKILPKFWPTYASWIIVWGSDPISCSGDPGELSVKRFGGNSLLPWLAFHPCPIYSVTFYLSSVRKRNILRRLLSQTAEGGATINCFKEKREVLICFFYFVKHDTLFTTSLCLKYNTYKYKYVCFIFERNRPTTTQEESIGSKRW